MRQVTAGVRSNWLTGVVLESLALAGLIGTQFVASAVVQDPPLAVQAEVQDWRKYQPRYLGEAMTEVYTAQAVVQCLTKRLQVGGKNKPASYGDYMACRNASLKQ